MGKVFILPLRFDICFWRIRLKPQGINPAVQKAALVSDVLYHLSCFWYCSGVFTI